MDPRGELMMEHRLIEKMLQNLSTECDKLKSRKTPDPIFIDSAADFMRTYADQTHHGKEEGILFRALSGKNMRMEDKKFMSDLVEEHAFSRRIVADLVEAKDGYLAGGGGEELRVVIEKMEVLIDFYPKHIDKEDNHFFPAAMEYLGVPEREKMLRDFWEFDRHMIHSKYTGLVHRMMEAGKNSKS